MIKSFLIGCVVVTLLVLAGYHVPGFANAFGTLLLAGLMVYAIVTIVYLVGQITREAGRGIASAFRPRRRPARVQTPPFKLRFPHIMAKGGYTGSGERPSEAPKTGSGVTRAEAEKNLDDAIENMHAALDAITKTQPSGATVLACVGYPDCDRFPCAECVRVPL